MNSKCKNCGFTTIEDASFCSNCGRLLKRTEKTLDFTPMLWGMGYYFLLLLVISIFSNIEMNPLMLKLWLSVFFLVATFTVAYNSNFKELLPLYQINKIDPVRMVVVIVLSVLVSLVLNLLLPQINNLIFKTEGTNLYIGFSLTRFSLFLILLNMAIVPAVFEEMAFRGFMFNLMKNYMNPEAAITVCSFLFAILHLNILSMFWLFPVALVWGWLRVKYNTIWYGMASHFFLNLTTFIVELNEVKHFIF